MRHFLLPILMLFSLVSVQAKTHVTVGTFGPIDCGKTTLTAAIVSELSWKGLAKYVTFDQIDCTPEEKERGISIEVFAVEYETENRIYTHLDCPGHEDYTDKVAKALAELDGAIFVVNAVHGIDQQTIDLLALAKEHKVSRLIVFINKCDRFDDTEVPDQIEKDMRVLLTEYGLDGENTPFIKSSALNALNGDEEEVDDLYKLLDIMDSWIPAPANEENSQEYVPRTGIQRF